MIVDLDTIMAMPEFAGQDRNVMAYKLEAIEVMIRAYTNNNFQNRFIRFVGTSQGDCLYGKPRYLKVGDTVQISQSMVNDGLYVVKAISDDHIQVDKDLFTYLENLVTKVEYPGSIRAGVIDLLKWEVANRDKVGIQSETLSRHSVTYFNQDANNQTMGYPVSLLGFLKPYMKARF